MRSADIYPTRRVLILVAVTLAISVLLVFDGDWRDFDDRGRLYAMLLAEGTLLALLLLDAVLVVRVASRIRADLTCARTWSLGRRETVEVRIDHRAGIAREVRLVLDLPRELRADPDELLLTLREGKRTRTSFAVESSARGRFHIGGVWLSVPSPFGLWRRHRRLGDRRDINVYPDLKQLSEYALLARTDRLSLIGVRRHRQAGGDTEFERLRDYQTGDPLQRVDWKATARRDQLTVRDYQVTQSQTVVFLIDTGRMMVTRDRPRGDGAEGESVSLLDRAIDACLMLAYVALVQGDRVGVVAYGERVSRYVPAKGGLRHLTQLIHALHDLDASLVESRHDEAFLHLQRHERKRALTVLITNLLDDVNADMVRSHLRSLYRRHLPMAVILRDPELYAPLQRPVEDEVAFWRAGAAADIVGWRERVLARLEQDGALVVDAELDELTPAVVSRYLEIKARHLL